jgi:hypothetical protein
MSFVVRTDECDKREIELEYSQVELFENIVEKKYL